MAKTLLRKMVYWETKLSLLLFKPQDWEIAKQFSLPRSMELIIAKSLLVLVFLEEPQVVRQPSLPVIRQPSLPVIRQPSLPVIRPPRGCCPPVVRQPSPPGVRPPRGCCPPGVRQPSPPGVRQPSPPGVRQLSPPGVVRPQK